MDVFDEMFSTFESSAYRIETLATYKIEGGEWDEFQNYQKGNILVSFANQEWVDQIRSWTDKGKQIRRVRVLPPVLTDYLRYEIEWCYPKNNIVGEKFSFISQLTYQKLVAVTLRKDFWLFDNKNALVMFYNSDGSYKGEELIRGELALPYVEIYNKLEQIALSFSETLNQIRSTKIKIKLP